MTLRLMGKMPMLRPATFSQIRSQIPGFGEGLEATVVGSLDGVRETAGGQLLRGDVIAEALATSTLVVAAGIGTVAVLEVLVFVAFHDRRSP